VMAQNGVMDNFTEITNFFIHQNKQTIQVPNKF